MASPRRTLVFLFRRRMLRSGCAISPGARAPVATWYRSGWKTWWLRRSTRVTSRRSSRPRRRAALRPPNPPPMIVTRWRDVGCTRPSWPSRWLGAEANDAAARRRAIGSAALPVGAHHPGMDAIGWRLVGRGTPILQRSRPAAAAERDVDVVAEGPAGGHAPEPLQERTVDP